MRAKRFCAIFFACAAVFAAVAGLGGCGGQTRFLRIHIRANSNAAEDQAVKLEVRDAVVAFLTPHLAGAVSFGDALSAARERLGAIEAVADTVLTERGLPYRAHADLRQEQFPTRVYGSVTLPSGVYDALILELGSGAGDNWWCVAYPPLCFGGAGQAEVKSLFWEWLHGCG